MKILDPKWTNGNELNYLKQLLENTNEVRTNPFTDRLERAFKAKFDCKYAIAMNSGASAIHAAMHAAGVGPGDEVITSPFSVLWDAAIAIIMGAKVRFADIKYGTHNIDPEKIKPLINSKTKAIIPVSYHGLPCDIDEIKKIGKENKIVIIEDNAQTMLGGYKKRLVGQDSDFSMFSFERTKHITCHEGGMLITNNDVLAKKARKFAGGGFVNLTSDKSKLAAIIPEEFQSPDYKRHDALGLNYRISEFCAAIALAQFEKVDEKVNLRREIAKLYDGIFRNYKDFTPQEVPTGYVHSYFTYSVKSPFNELQDWKRFYKFHTSNGGDTFYAMMATVYKEKIMQELGYDKECSGTCPITEEIQPRCILFKTNYRDLNEAKKNIEILEKNLNLFFK
jgi:perosamine synthetase